MNEVDLCSADTYDETIDDNDGGDDDDDDDHSM